MLIPSWLNFRRSIPARRRTNRPKQNSRLAVERLEERDVPTVGFGWAFDLGIAGNTVVVNGVATDSADNVYVDGSFTGTLNANPLGAAYNITSANNGTSISQLVAKYSSTGALDWAVPGSSAIGYGIAADTAGDVYVFTKAPDVSKYDANGNLLWRTTLSSWVNNVFGGGNLALDANGNAYAIGTNSSTGAFYISKVLSTGSVAWTDSVVTGTGNDLPELAVDSAGNVYVAGSYYGKVDFDPGPGTYYMTPLGGKTDIDAFVEKLDTNGNFVWAGSMGTNTADNARSITLDGAGALYVEGTWGSTSAPSKNDFDPGAGVYALPWQGHQAVFIEKLDTNRNFQWAETLGGGSTSGENQVATDSSGNVYFAGTFNGTVNFNPSGGTYNLTNSGNNNNSFIDELNSSGTFIWAGSFSGSNNYPHSLVVDNVGDIYTVGGFQGTVNFDPTGGTYNVTAANAAGTGKSDAYVVKLTQSSAPAAATASATVRTASSVLQPTAPAFSSMADSLVVEALVDALRKPKGR
jgi:hypothetical protein